MIWKPKKETEVQFVEALKYHPRQTAIQGSITQLQNAARTSTDSLGTNVLDNNRIRTILILAGLSVVIFSFVTTVFILKSTVDLTRFMVSKTFHREYTWK